MTRKMPSSTSQAAPVCEPAKRDLRPSRLGSDDSLMIAKVTMPTRTATANRSSMKPTHAHVPISGMAKCLLNSAPYASMMVRIKTMKPQKVSACATPGTVHWSSLRCPITWVTCVSAPSAGCSRSACTRSGAGWPVRPSR